MKSPTIVMLLALLVFAAPSGSERRQSVKADPQAAVSSPHWDTFSDTWGATDALGRALPGYEQVGPPRKDRFVGVFYFLWHGAHVNGGPYDITKILQQDPDAMQKPDSPLWGPIGAPHHWGEPLFGYYVSDDAWVFRKHAQMLSDAGVDVIIFDVTNQFTYRSAYRTLLRVFSEVRASGGKTPQVTFLCPFGSPARVVQELYTDLYEPGLYRDLWFRWEGKPLLLADPNLLGGGEGVTEQNTPSALTPGHTLGQSLTAPKPFEAVGGRFPTWATQGSALTLTLYREGPKGERITRRRFEKVTDNAWLSLTLERPLPAGTYYLEASEPKGRIGWWSHTDDVYPDGQAFADGAPIPGDRTLQIITTGGPHAALRKFFTFRKPQPDYFQGPTAPNMWSWLEVSPQHVFRNAKGEKEQMSVGAAQNAIGNRLGTLSEPGARGRSFHQGARDPRPDAELYGYNAAEQWERALKEDPKFLFVTGWNEWFASRYNEFLGVKRPVMFVDTFNQENSRDIEPMQGGHGDNYYYQMISYIRKYKGVRKPPIAGPPRTIRLDDDFRQWDDVQPEFRDDIGDTAHRDHPGYNNFTRYVNKTGRNDFVLLKVARDRQYLYFYARTKDPITPHTDPHWMMLFLNIDGDPKTGWEGYDFVVNRVVQDATTTSLEQSRGGWNWQRRAEVRYRVKGNELMLAIRRADLGLTDAAKPLRLDFKWADNLQKEGEITEFTLNGDSAPNGRFYYRYREEAR
jgi:hypothetical protein